MQALQNLESREGQIYKKVLNPSTFMEIKILFCCLYFNIFLESHVYAILYDNPIILSNTLTHYNAEKGTN